MTIKLLDETGRVVSISHGTNVQSDGSREHTMLWYISDRDGCSYSVCTCDGRFIEVS